MRGDAHQQSVGCKRAEISANTHTQGVWQTYSSHTDLPARAIPLALGSNAEKVLLRTVQIL